MSKKLICGVQNLLIFNIIYISKYIYCLNILIHILQKNTFFSCASLNFPEFQQNNPDTIIKKWSIP